MSKIWIIAPKSNENLEIFNDVWKYNIENNNISLGWGQLDDNFLSLSKEDRLKIAKSTYEKDDPKHTSRQIKYFYEEISINDIIIARYGLKKIIGIGKVLKKAQKESNNYLSKYDHSNILDIQWMDIDTYKYEGTFARHTISKAEKLKISLPESVVKIISKIASESQNPNLPIKSIKLTFEEQQELIGLEGKEIIEWKFYRSIERDSLFARKCKYNKIVLQNQNTCEICDFDSKAIFGILPINFLELHHLKPLSIRKSIENTHTFESDVVLLCPNCHTAIHRLLIKDKLKEMTITQFKESIKNQNT